ncbi:N-acetylmuramoyl-L-alanine amidase [Enterovirga rhinocerotis]|uniref:N-acetyl-anhydromuramyl-L-alanine amidase AmpD n=1 Tax=Enterovirga rhinocerotis TaxID=1339210 RepID=A0A4R7BXN8_9HYPH|nr:peptidoglycan-binding domain-containing protein [Enterovirga rhinocerotis]TDR88967.1 N-acetyl-anhydromuramyl-L-alanine amidase AmpD [Enterovirga rhinocerotis]
MSTCIVPAEWMPDARVTGIVVHWTGGPHRATSLDRSHYHVVIEADGSLVRGTPSIDLNGLPRVRKGYAAHTRNCNSGWIGVSLACMAGATETPFDAGSAPMTRTQWEMLPRVLADLCRRYAIAVTPRTVLSHAEVQATLGIPQRGKWDITRLAFDPDIEGAAACGDLFRSRTAALLGAPAAEAAPAPVDGVAPLPEPPPPLLEATKRRLRELGYFTVGAVDAEIGPRTIAALSQFQSVAGLPVTGRLDASTMEAIWAKTAPAAPIAAKRAGLDASDLAAAGNAVVAAARRGKLASLVGLGFGLAGAAWSALNEHFGEAWAGLAPFRQIVDAPDWLWGILACGVAIILYRQSHVAEEAEVAAARTGRLS